MSLNLAEMQQTLSRLLANIAESDRHFYAIFFSPTPQDVTLRRFDDAGAEVFVTIPNLAKLRASGVVWQGGPFTPGSVSSNSFYGCNVIANEVDAAGIPFQFITSEGEVLLRLLSGYCSPGSDSIRSVGLWDQRWTTGYFTSGIINTSDATEKALRGPLTEAELRVARRIANLVQAFQWMDSIAEKGADGARLHVGPTAQDVARAFGEEGLDPARYGLWCKDKVVEDGTEKTRLALRPDQLALFLAAAHEQALSRTEARLEALEAKVAALEA